MTEHEYRPVSETGRRNCNDALRQCQNSRDFWKFIAVMFIIISLLCILELYDCLPDLN